jgi:hypothetical protein
MEALATSIGRYVHHDVADFVGDVIIAEIPGKGRGLRTTRDIPAGTLLLASKAFATGSPQKWASKSILFLAFYVTRNQIVRGADVDLVGNIICTLRKNPQRTSEFYQLYAGESSRVELPDGMIDPGTIERIVDLNAFGIENEFDLVPPEKMMKSSGLWILPSFLNHSCVPNAHRCFYGDVMMVRAIRDLRAGEEVVISYCGDGPEARQDLMSWWKIDCDCPCCNERMKTPRQAAQRRNSLLKNGPWSSGGPQRLSPIMKWIQSLDATYNPGDQFKSEMCQPLLNLMAAHMREANADHAIATGRRILGLQPYIQAGFEIMAHMMIACVYVKTGRPDSAKEELRIMRDFCWKRVRITLRQLRLVATQAMKQGDPNIVLADTLRELEEAQLAYPLEPALGRETEI